MPHQPREEGRKAEESKRVSDHTPYQRKIIDRYYKNFDAIKFQRLSELATDLYLAEGKKLDRLWGQVESSLRKLEVAESRISELIRRRDPAMLVAILKEFERR
jgi:hypothetical protein